MFKEIFIYGLYYIIHASPPHHPTPNGNKMHPSQFANHGSFFCLFVVPPLQNAEGLDNHLGSYPGCLDELGISCAPNWAATLKLPSVTTSSKAINHHLFCVKTKAELATNHLVEVRGMIKMLLTQNPLCPTLLPNASNVPPLPPLEEPARNSSI
jgi:hypothetical protein